MSFGAVLKNVPISGNTGSMYSCRIVVTKVGIV